MTSSSDEFPSDPAVYSWRSVMVLRSIVSNIRIHVGFELRNAPINVKLLGGGGGGEEAGHRRGIELRSVFLFNCPAPGKSSWVKKVQMPHFRVIIVGQENSTNDQKSLPRADL